LLSAPAASAFWTTGRRLIKLDLDDEQTLVDVNVLLLK
jgi:hypothetical protein